MSNTDFSDFHETEAFQPTMLALSHFAIQWNWAEHSFNVLLWQYVGDMQTGAMYTAGLGNQSRADTLLALARKKEKNKDVINKIEFVASVFGKLKSNRNSLLHAHSIHKYEDEEKPRWIRASNNPKSVHIYCHADNSDVTHNFMWASALGNCLLELIVYYTGTDKTPPSFERFPEPKVLLPIPIQFPEP